MTKSISFSPLIPPRLHLGGHLQTILAAKISTVPYPKPVWQRERWAWADEGQGSDFCDADWLHPTHATPITPLLILFHGLEGSSESHYARSIGAYFQAQGWRVVVPHFRGCSGEPNHLLRAYHSGDTAEIERMLANVHEKFPAAPLYTVGVSLGGNALLCYLAAPNPQIPLQAAASICAPLDLARCSEALTKGVANIYTLAFMRTLHTKALEKRQRFPNACDWNSVLASKNLAQFDNAFTAPVHGYHDATDYYTRASAKPKLPHIMLPTLLLNALNDPFVPHEVLADLIISPSVQIYQPTQGGHVGFATAGKAWGRGELTWLPQQLHQWFNQCEQIS